MSIHTASSIDYRTEQPAVRSFVATFSLQQCDDLKPSTHGINEADHVVGSSSLVASSRSAWHGRCRRCQQVQFFRTPVRHILTNRVWQYLKRQVVRHKINSILVSLSLAGEKSRIFAFAYQRCLERLLETRIVEL